MTKSRANRTHVVLAERVDGRRTVFSVYASERDAEVVARQFRSHGLGASVEPITAIADATPGSTVRYAV